MFANDPNLLWVAVDTLLLALFYFYTSKRVGSMRGRHKIYAPAVTGHPDFERALRVQMNTLEQMVPFLISLWLCALAWNSLIAALLGALFLLGRLMYAIAYYGDPSRRMMGFMLGFLAMALLWIGAAFGIINLLLQLK